MVSTNVSQAVTAFAAALNGLRQRYVENFAASLNEPFNRRKLGAARTSDKIASLRKEFAAEFVNTTSVPVIRTLSPEAEQSIVEQLNGLLIQSQSLASAAPAPAPTAPGNEMWRAMVGAGLGVAAALILLTMQMHGPFGERVAPPASTVSQPGGGTPGGGSGAAPTPAEIPPATSETPPGPPKAEGSDGTPPPPPPAASAASPPAPVTSGAAPGSRSLAAALLIWIVGGTLGAVLGTFLVCFPSPPMFARRGESATSIPLGKRRDGGARLSGSIIAAGIGIVTGAVALIGLLLSGPKPLWTAFAAVCAISLILLARFLTLPKRASARSTDAVETLQRELVAESNFWSVLAGGLVSQRTDFRVVADLKSIILEHRERGAQGEDILQLVEQELGLAAGGQAATASKPALGDFIWTAGHEKLYDTFGIVEIGDRVKVKVPPRTVTSPSGATTVVQRGLVSRQREH